MKKTKTNNKGFSLVELIVVLAIMAVLMTVLAPALLRYVEKSRLQKDNSGIGEIMNAVEIALADEKINEAVGSSTEITIGNDAEGAKSITFSSTDKLQAELKNTIGDTFTTSSNTYKNSTDAITIHVANSTNGVTFTLDGYYSDTDTKEGDGYTLK